MRSFTSSRATDMDRLLWFSLLFAYLQSTGMMAVVESCLSQPDKMIWKKTGESVSLPCKVSPHCLSKSLQYEWYHVNEESRRVDPARKPPKYRLEGTTLHIGSLGVNDSGVYHCAARSHGESADTNHVGTGTPLVVRERVKTMARHILLWIAFVLLAIYSLALVMLILKKHGFKMTRKTDKKNSTRKKSQFRDVLQEMYNRRISEGRQQSRKRSPAEPGNTDFRSSADDIYENV